MQIHYWIIHILVIFGLIGGLVFKATTIFEGNINKFGDRKQISKWGKFWHYIGRFFKNFFSKNFWFVVLGVFLDVLFHFKLLREKPLKWVIHTLLFWGLFLLFLFLTNNTISNPIRIITHAYNITILNIFLSF